MSQQNSPTSDSSKIEKIIQQIKENISEAVPKTDLPQDTTFYVENQDGIRAYHGKPLEKKVPDLVKGLKLGEVRELGGLNNIMWLIYYQGLTWSLAYFSQPRPIKNKFSRMWLVPLCDNAIITPGGPLQNGVCTFIQDQPILSSASTVIFIAPE
jgi:hypothetical protein